MSKNGFERPFLTARPVDSLAACPSGRRDGWAVRRFDSLVLNEVPDVALCLCAQGEGAFLRIAPQRCKSKEPPLVCTVGPSTVSKINGERIDYLRTPTYDLDRACRPVQILNRAGMIHPGCS
jgi:hypothetical protein